MRGFRVGALNPRAVLLKWFILAAVQTADTHRLNHLEHRRKMVLSQCSHRSHGSDLLTFYNNYHELIERLSNCHWPTTRHAVCRQRCARGPRERIDVVNDGHSAVVRSVYRLLDLSDLLE